MTRSKPKVLPQSQPWRRWYSSVVWKKQASYQLRIEPLCRLCEAEGRVVVATIADHVVHHDEDWNRFRLGKLQSLCGACHARKHGRAPPLGYSLEIGADGWPIDPQHPANKPRTGKDNTP
jgi:5-methylcytosine-specific restriction endonuclease McrA